MKKSELFATTRKKIDYSIPQTITVYKAKYDAKSKKQIFDDIEFSYEYKPLINKREVSELNSIFQDKVSNKYFNEFINQLQYRFCFYFESCIHKTEDAIKNIDLTKKDSISHYIDNEIRLLKEGNFEMHGFVIFKGLDKDKVNKVHLIAAIKHLFHDISRNNDLKDFQGITTDSIFMKKYSEQLEVIDQTIINLVYFRTIEYLEKKIDKKPQYNNMTQLITLAYYIRTKNGLKHKFSRKETEKIGKELGVGPVAFYNTFHAIDEGKLLIENIKNKEYVLELLSAPKDEKSLKYAIEILKIEPGTD